MAPQEIEGARRAVVARLGGVLDELEEIDRALLRPVDLLGPVRDGERRDAELLVDEALAVGPVRLA